MGFPRGIFFYTERMRGSVAVATAFDFDKYINMQQGRSMNIIKDNALQISSNKLINIGILTY